MKKLFIILCLFSSCAKSQDTLLFGVKTSKLNILCRGNSLTTGSFVVQDSSYPGRLQAFFYHDIVRQQGIPGDQIVYTMLSTIHDSIELHYLRGYNNIVIQWEITNSLVAALTYGGQTPSSAIDSTYEQTKRFCLISKGYGFTALSSTCIARVGIAPSNFDSCRLVINARMKANFPALGIYVIPLDEDPRLSNALDPTYYNADQVHLVSAGYRAVYEDVLSKLLEVLYIWPVFIIGYKRERNKKAA